MALLFIMSISVAHSQQVNKCATKTGTEYRSGPCNGGSATKTWSAQAAPRMPEVAANERRLDQIRLESAARARRARTAPASRGTAIQFSQHKAPDRRRTFALGRKMHDLVHESCN